MSAEQDKSKWPDPLLSRFASSVGLVTFRQTFVLRCHGDATRRRAARTQRRLICFRSFSRGATRVWISNWPAIAPVARRSGSTWAEMIANRDAAQEVASDLLNTIEFKSWDKLP